MHTFDIPVEDGVVVLATSCKCKEVTTGFGTELAEQLNFDVAVSGVEG